MIIQLEDGRKLEVPNGATPQEIDATVAEVMAKSPARSEGVNGGGTTLGGIPSNAPSGPEIRPSAANPTGFAPNLKPNIQMPDQLPFGMPKSAINEANKRINANNEYEKSFIGDEERQALKKLEQERPFISSVIEGAKHVGKQFQAGTALAPEFLPQSVQDILNYQPFGENLPADERKKQVADYMAKEKERYEITRRENIGSTMIGEMLPYLATGIAGDRAFNIVGKTLEGPLKAGSITMNRKLGNTVEVERMLNQPARLPSEYEQKLNTVLKGTATGAAEGAGQYDTTAGEGAATSFIGGLSGMFGPITVLNKTRNERDAAGKKIIDEMYRQGLHITPGIRTGNRALQTEEAAIRNSDVYGQEFANQVDRPNQRRMTAMAGEAIGLNTKDRDLLSQVELSDHMKNLKGSYTALEANTTGKYGLRQIREVGKVLADLKPTRNRNTSPVDQQRYAIVNGFAKQLKTEMGSPQRGSNGRFLGYQFNGTQYQGLRSRLQDEISQAYQGGDKRLGDSLRKVQTVLDDSLINGMNNATAKQWKDLNERYSMTRLLLDKGMTPSGKVDPTAITSAVMGGDEAMRTLTGKGGRIKQLQNIARYNDVLHGEDVAGGALTGLGKAERHTIERGLLKRARDYAMRPVDLFGLSYRLNTNRMPFIGRRLSPAHGLDPNASIHIQRAAAQTETPQDYVRDKYQELLDVLKSE